MSMRLAASAANRFGLGARPGELERIGGDAPGWLRAQLKADATIDRFDRLTASVDYLRREFEFTTARRRARTAAGREGGDDEDQERPGTFQQTFGGDLMDELHARYTQALTTESPFIERLVHFWSNHFAVSVDKRQATLYAAPMEREAIRPRVAGRFADLLLAVETHPAMLRYLDNVESVGRDSRYVTRTRRRTERQDEPDREPGLNENLAREILELHTLGVDGGYAQADVEELARAITGWSIPAKRDVLRGTAEEAFIFREAVHQPGPREVLGKRYAEGGFEQGRAVLEDLAVQPATARHLSFKLARHFVCDEPPRALVDRLAATWQGSGGDLAAVYATLVESGESWQPAARKFKTPDDFVVSALRASGIDEFEFKILFGLLRELGQAPFTPRSPAGYGDTLADWNGADALFKRVQVATSLAERTPRRKPLELARTSLGPDLEPDLAEALRRAESAEQGRALFLASPAFQWRT